MKKIISLLVATLLLCSTLLALTSCKEEEIPNEESKLSAAVEEVLKKDGEWRDSFEEFYRIDCDSSTAWQGEIEGLRIITKDRYQLGEAKEKYNLDKNYPVSLEGLDDLNASASAQFSVDQFRELADTLREVADGKKIVIVDLREESHYFLNGISISRFGLHNWGNLGMNLTEVEAEEKKDFGSLVGTVVTAYSRDDEEKLEDHLVLDVETAISEKELVESEGFEYLRLDCTDHVWPDAEEIDEFINYVKKLDTDNLWFHFHCAGGSGRTGAFMMIYDKMKNPTVSDKDILYRQTMMGSNYPLYLGEGDSYKDPLYKEKAEMAPLIFDYIKENHKSNYEISWSEWLKNK